ncbi:MAG: hypothetical protein ACREJ0_24130 [Geminicoccaceae bacterium]
MDNIARALKVFVIAGGIALLAGTVLLVVLIVLRASENPSNPPANSQTETRARAEAGPAPTRLCEAGLPPLEPLSVPLGVPLPAGARIEQVVPGGGCLILIGVDGAGRQFVALVDPFTGERISLLLIRPEE